MTAMNTNLQGTGPVLRKRAIGLLAWLACAMPFAASAENVLQDINFVPGEAGRVDITLQLEQASSDAQVFTTDQPPRIAIDLPDTRNAVEQRRLAVGQGSTSAISAVEAAGRTRVVIDLFRPASYETRVEGNNLIISVAGGAAAGNAMSANAAIGIASHHAIATRLQPRPGIDSRSAAPTTRIPISDCAIERPHTPSQPRLAPGRTSKATGAATSATIARGTIHSARAHGVRSGWTG